MTDGDNPEASAKPATSPRPYALHRHRHPGALRQRPLAGAPGAGPDKGDKGHRQAPGLSKASYCHKTHPFEPAGPLSLTYYQGASLVDLQGPAATLAPAHSKAAKRQKIGEWSQPSRNRLRRLLATVLTDALDQALVLTLTYPAEFPPPEKFATYKNHLRVFCQALARRFPQCSGTWKLEFQARGAAHFHLLCFGLQHEPIAAVRDWITQRWYAIAHAGDKHLGSAGCQADPVKHRGGFINYLTKYLNKTGQTRPGDFTGRYWGTFARDRLPIGQSHTLQLTPAQWVKVRRLARKKIEKDMDATRWRNFLKNINPRKPSPSWGVVCKGPASFGDRLWWEQLISAWHGGARSFHALQWLPGEWIEADYLWLEPGFAHSSTSTSIVPRYRPPSRYKAKHLNHFRLLCHADAFVSALAQGIQRGLI